MSRLCFLVCVCTVFGCLTHKQIHRLRMLRKILLASGLGKSWPSVTAEEVQENPYFIVAGNNVYNVASILGGEHPGGDNCLLRRGGGAMDCTRDLHFHSPSGRKKWETLKVGELSREERMKLEARYTRGNTWTDSSCIHGGTVNNPSPSSCFSCTPL